jgi:hypothetical protein
MLAHIAIRVPLVTRIYGQGYNTIQEHNAVVSKLGRVAFAKFGQAGTASRAERLRQQILRGQKTFLIAVVKREDSFFAFEARLGEVHFGPPTAQLSEWSPPYYKKIQEIPSLWFVLNGPLKAIDINLYFLLSNSRPLLDVVRESRTASMLVIRQANKIS